MVVDSPPSYDGLPGGRWPSENMPCKFDGTLHFKSNSSPEAVYLPGYLLPVPGTSVGSVRQCHKYPGCGTAFSYLSGTRATILGFSGSSVRLLYPYPELLEVLYDMHTRTRPELLKFCKNSIPVPETSASCVRLPYPYPESTTPLQNMSPGNLFAFCGLNYFSFDGGIFCS